MQCTDTGRSHAIFIFGISRDWKCRKGIPFRRGNILMSREPTLNDLQLLLTTYFYPFIYSLINLKPIIRKTEPKVSLNILFS